MLKSLIALLAGVSGPPGQEKAVREVVKGSIGSSADVMDVDQMGNLIARKLCPGSHGRRIMLTAHMDEVGLMISHVDKRGFARFSLLGPLDLRSAVGQQVRFLNGLPGVIGCENSSENSKDLTADQLFIDVGASSPQDCPVRIGDTAVFSSTFTDLGTRISSKALDNRVGVALMIELLQQMSEQKLTPTDEYCFVFSAQGQPGGRGARVAAFSIEPDLCITIDLTSSGGTPQSPFSTLEMGKGPAIRIRDQMLFSDPNLVEWIRNTAEKNNIPYQTEIREISGKGLENIQTTQTGIPMATISIPSRYLHSPTEMADLGDIQNAIQLLVALISEPC
jgi:tetrahedral aminopeptidase